MLFFRLNKSSKKLDKYLANSVGHGELCGPLTAGPWAGDVLWLTYFNGGVRVHDLQLERIR